MLMSFSILAGGMQFQKPFGDDVMFTGVTVMLLLYCFLLFIRRGRKLPPALQKVGYTRLGYLREAFLKGQRIGRMQDMPPEGCGDANKAAYLIITSHRWLDRFTCDVTTDTYQHGVRLETMVRNMDTYFPQSIFAVGGTCTQRLFRIFQGMRTGGNDVLLFFDFMGLPQIGKTESGELIQRTEAEDMIFKEALPAMGALYTMYPVIVLPEVVPNVHPYFSSGWCFSEFTSAVLTKKAG